MNTTEQQNDASQLFCPNVDCSARGKIGAGNLVSHGKKRERYTGKTCGRTCLVNGGIYQSVFARLTGEHQQALSPDMFEIKRADGTTVRGGFPLWKRTRHIPGLACEDQRRAAWVTAALHTRAFDVPAALFPRDQSTPCGAAATRQLLLEKGFQRSMSRAGTPTDNGSAERVVGMLQLAVAECCRHETLGEFVRAAQEWVLFSRTIRPHERLDSRSPDHGAREHG
jgi:hypothetical protein